MLGNAVWDQEKSSGSCRAEFGFSCEEEMELIPVKLRGWAGTGLVPPGTALGLVSALGTQICANADFGVKSALFLVVLWFCRACPHHCTLVKGCKQFWEHVCLKHVRIGHKLQMRLITKANNRK